MRHRNRSKQTLVCSESLLVVQGITGKAQKWRRHGWQGSAGPVGHVDLWTQLLQETEAPGAEIQWLHVSSHISVENNTKVDQLADLGRRQSPLLRGQVNVSRAGVDRSDDSDMAPESDLEEPLCGQSWRELGTMEPR